MASRSSVSEGALSASALIELASKHQVEWQDGKFRGVKSSQMDGAQVTAVDKSLVSVYDVR